MCQMVDPGTAACETDTLTTELPRPVYTFVKLAWKLQLLEFNLHVSKVNMIIFFHNPYPSIRSCSDPRIHRAFMFLELIFRDIF